MVLTLVFAWKLGHVAYYNISRRNIPRMEFCFTLTDINLENKMEFSLFCCTHIARFLFNASN